MSKMDLYHVYAEDGFEKGFKSETSARSYAKRGSKKRKGVGYSVVKASAIGYSGGGQGSQVAEYFDGKES